MKNRAITALALVAVFLSLLTGPANATVINFANERPFKLLVAPTYSKAKPAPLLIVLHGYTSNGGRIARQFGLDGFAQKAGFLMVYPDGTKDSGGNSFWNATDACCNFYGSKVDDEGYLMTIMDLVSAKYSVDPKRIYLIGHSNGGFMAHRMACAHADRIAAVISVAGAQFADSTKCNANSPISVLQIHGSADETISYQGGFLASKAYPSASQSVASWSKLNECNQKEVILKKKLDLDAKIAGPETSVHTFTKCKNGSEVLLWETVGGGHMPDANQNFAAQIIKFLMAHPKQ